MSYSLDANLLLYASDSSSPRHEAASLFIEGRATDRDLLCLSWLTIMAFVQIATHPSIFPRPLTPGNAWKNVDKLLGLSRTRLIGELDNFASDYEAATAEVMVRGNLVPDAHLATILRQHGVSRIYTADSDFRKFSFLEVVNPLIP